MRAVIDNTKTLPFVMGFFRVLRENKSSVVTIASTPLAEDYVQTNNVLGYNDLSTNRNKFNLKDKFRIKLSNGMELKSGQNYFIIARLNQTNSCKTTEGNDNSTPNSVDLIIKYCKKINKNVDKEYLKYISGIPSETVHFLRSEEDVKMDLLSYESDLSKRDKFLKKAKAISYSKGNTLSDVVAEQLKLTKLSLGISVKRDLEGKNFLFISELPFKPKTQLPENLLRKYLKYKTPYFFRTEALENRNVLVYEMGLWGVTPRVIGAIQRGDSPLCVSLSRPTKPFQEQVDGLSKPPSRILTATVLEVPYQMLEDKILTDLDSLTNSGE